MYVPHFLYSRVCQWTFRLFLPLGWWELCCNGHGSTMISLFWINTQKWDCWIIWQQCYLSFWGASILFSRVSLRPFISSEFPGDVDGSGTHTLRTNVLNPSSQPVSSLNALRTSKRFSILTSPQEVPIRLSRTAAPYQHSSKAPLGHSKSFQSYKILVEVSQLSHLWHMTQNPRVAPALWGLMVETRQDAIYICWDFSWKPGDHMSHLPFKLWFFKERYHLVSPPSPEKLVEMQALGPSRGPPNHKVGVRALEMVTDAAHAGEPPGRLRGRTVFL